MTPDELDDPVNDTFNKVALWYFDRWLPYAAKKEFYNENIRYYKLFTDKMNVNGQQKVCVTITAEAFALLVLENCHTKWQKIFKYKKEHGKKAAIPAKGDAAKPYRGKWSEPKQGQVKLGGWNEAALVFMSQMEDKLVAIREEDAQNNNIKAKYYLELMRKKHGITDAVPFKKGSRKKKKTSTDQPEQPKQKKLKRRDE